MIHPSFPKETQSPQQRNALHGFSPITRTSTPNPHWITVILSEKIPSDHLDSQSFIPWKAVKPQTTQEHFSKNAGTLWNKWLERDSTPYFLPLFNQWELESTFLEKSFWALHTHETCPWVNSYSVLRESEELRLWNTGFDSGSAFLRADLVRSPVLIKHKVWKELNGFAAGLSPEHTLWEFFLRASQQGLWGKTIPEYLAWGKSYPQSPLPASMEKILEDNRLFFNKRPFPEESRESSLPSETKAFLQKQTPLFQSIANRDSVLLLTSEKSRISQRIELLKLLASFQKVGWQTNTLLVDACSSAELADWSLSSETLFALGNFIPESYYPLFIKSFLENRRPSLLIVDDHFWLYHLLPWLRAWFPNLPIAGWHDIAGHTSRNTRLLANPHLVNQTWCSQHIAEQWFIQTFPQSPKPLRVHLPQLELPIDPDGASLAAPSKRILLVRETSHNLHILLDRIEKLSFGMNQAQWILVSEDSQLISKTPSHPLIQRKQCLQNYRDWRELLKEAELIWIPYPELSDITLVQSTAKDPVLFLIPESELSQTLTRERSVVFFNLADTEDVKQFQNGVLPLLKKPDAIDLQRKRKLRQSHTEGTFENSGVSRAIHQLILTSGSGGNVTLPPQLSDLWLDLNEQLSQQEGKFEKLNRRIEELKSSIKNQEIDLRTRLYYALQDHTFEEGRSIDRKITPGKQYKLRFSLSQISGISGLRFDPIDFPGIVTIESLLLFRELTLTPLWNSDDFPKFTNLRLEGTGTLLESSGSWKILAYGPDPQIYLPWEKEWERFSDLAVEVRISVALGLADLLPLLKPDAHTQKTISLMPKG